MIQEAVGNRNPRSEIRRRPASAHRRLRLQAISAMLPQ
jgi:hypothetical protein